VLSPFFHTTASATSHQTVQSVDVQSVDVQSVDVQSVDVQSVDIQSVDVQSVDVQSVDVQSVDVQTTLNYLYDFISQIQFLLQFASSSVCISLFTHSAAALSHNPYTLSPSSLDKILQPTPYRAASLCYFSVQN